MSARRRLVATVAALVLGAGAVLTGCSSDDEGDAGASTPTGEQSAGGDAGTDGGSTGSGTDGGSSDGGSDGESSGSGSSDPSASPSADGEPDPADPDDGEPGQPDGQGRQGDVFDRIPGSDGAGCVAVGDRRDVRSGGFVAGAFDDARAGYGTERAGFAKRDVRIYFVPMHAAEMPGARITASGPGGVRGDVVRVTSGDTDAWKFYDSTIRLPQRGEWTFRVSSGPDSGCFTATI